MAILKKPSKTAAHTDNLDEELAAIKASIQTYGSAYNQLQSSTQKAMNEFIYNNDHLPNVSELEHFQTDLAIAFANKDFATKSDLLLSAIKRAEAINLNVPEITDKLRKLQASAEFNYKLTLKEKDLETKMNKNTASPKETPAQVRANMIASTKKQVKKNIKRYSGKVAEKTGVPNAWHFFKNAIKTNPRKSLKEPENKKGSLKR